MNSFIGHNMTAKECLNRIDLNNCLIELDNRNKEIKGNIDNTMTKALTKQHGDKNGLSL